MSYAVDIPKINITPEAEEDDDHIIMNLSEALTDIEDLFENDSEPINPTINKRSKLKIKLSNDGDVTELEDFEASSEEEDTKLTKHLQPISFKDLDLETPIIEENYKKQENNTEGKRKVKTEFATKQKSFFQSLSEEENASDEGVVTDSEGYDTENEINEPEIPETEINLELYKADNLVSDNLASFASTPGSAILDHSENDGGSVSSTGILHLVNTLGFVSKQGKNLTDIEILHSDTDSQEEIKIIKTRRRGHKSKKKPLTDMEDLYLSDDNAVAEHVKKPKRKQKCFHVKSHSMPFDSENEDDGQLPFPVCKQIAKKNPVSLRIPEFDTNFLTDLEDIEGNSDIEKAEINFVDETALEEKLKEMAASYGQVKEETSETKKGKQYSNKVEIKTVNEIEKGNTDEDEFATDEADVNEISVKDDSVAYKIKFSPSNSSLKSSGIPNKSQLTLPVNPEDPLTDCENIDSSPEETEPKKIPIAVVQKQDLTDNEEFSDDDSRTEGVIPEIQLPPPTRNLILLQENQSIVPTVRIMPLDSLSDENKESSQDNEQGTDEESFSDAEDALSLLDVDQPRRAPTPDLPFLEGGLVNVSENINKSNKCYTPVLTETLTDTEEVILDTKHKKRRAPKFKHLHEKSLASKKTLLTDTEDICLSDNSLEKKCLNTGVLLHVPQNSDCVLTDSENIALSGDEQEYSQTRPYSATPEHMKVMGGETVFQKEGSGPFSIIDKLELNRFSLKPQNAFVTPATTDSEDVMVSAEEDIDNTSIGGARSVTPNHVHCNLDQMLESKVQSELTRKFDSNAPEEVMYLKGGGYSEQHTDVECLMDDEANTDYLLDFLEDKCKKENVAFNFKNCSASFAYTEWDASRKPADITDQSTLEKAAAQKGTEHSQPSGSQQGASLHRVESEEAHDKADQEKSKKVSDQHQLSDEMKELLKEMEKESKQ